MSEINAGVGIGPGGALVIQGAEGNQANVVAGDSGFNGVATAGATKTYTFTTSASGVQTLLANTPTEGFSWAEIVLTANGTGLVWTAPFSTISGGTYVSTSSWGTSANNASSAGLGSSTNVIYGSKISGNFMQLEISALTSGTVTGTLTLRAVSPGYNVLASSQSGTWTVGSNSVVGSAVPANAFYIGIKNSGNLTGVASPNDAGATGSGGASILGSQPYVWNGSTFDAQVGASKASNTTGTGLLGVGLLEWDGTNYQRVPAARFSPASTKLNTYAVKITTNTTTTPTASTAYISSIAISADVVGTTSTITIQDKSGTPLKVVNGLSTTALTTTPTIVNFQTPILATGGIDIVTAGAVAATVDVFLNYYQ